MNANRMIYEQVLRGLAEEWIQVERLERGFSQELGTLKKLDALAHGDSTTEAPPNADRWARAERLFCEIEAHTLRLRQALETPLGDGASDMPLTECSILLKQEDELLRLLVELKAGTAQVSSDQELALAAAWAELDGHFDVLRAHCRAVHVKLEMRKRFGEAEATALTQQIMARLPEDLQSEAGIAAYHEAVTELQEEKQKFKGFLDVMKSLFLYVEGPEERAQKKRIL